MKQLMFEVAVFVLVLLFVLAAFGLAAAPYSQV